MDNAETSVPPNPPDQLEDLGAAEVAEFGLPREGGAYDPSRQREQIRSWLALGAGLLLVFTILLVTLPVVIGRRTWDDMEGLASTVLPAVLSVAGSIIGFYFGADKAARR